MGNHFLPRPYCKTINEDDAYIRNIIKGNCNIPPATQFSYTPLLPTNFPFQFLFYVWTPPVSNRFLFLKVKSATVFNHTPPSSPPDPTLSLCLSQSLVIAQSPPSSTLPVDGLHGRGLRANRRPPRVCLLGGPPPATGAPPRRTAGGHGRGSEAGIRPTSGAAVK
jgi:hypothetical protein